MSSTQAADQVSEETTHASRPPARPKRSNFDQEPNPFEQSFATRPPGQTSGIRSSVRHANSNDSKTTDDGHAPSETSDRRSPDDESKPTLPPLASISSPSESYPWGFSSASQAANSLRAGPLSPIPLPALPRL